MNLYILAALCICYSVNGFCQESETRTFQLKNGDKVSGQVLAETDSSFLIKTSFGEITVLRKDLKPREITVYLKDGNRISGEIISQTTEQLILKTSFGSVTLDSQNIERTTEQGVELPGTEGKEEFNYSQSRLVDVFFDPTGYTLEKGSIYLSGLSWGVGLSDKIDISSSYWRYFIADLNIRPKFKIYSSGNIESEQALAVGFHLHAAGPTLKRKYTTYYSSYSYLPTPELIKEWKMVGDFNDYFLWTEVFAAYTISKLKSDNRGRIASHFGVSMIFHKAEAMPRFWIAVENDITEKFKVLGQVYFDQYQPSYRESINNTNSKNPLDLDFGFVYAFSNNFRVGIHYQPYVILFYYEF